MNANQYSTFEEIEVLVLDICEVRSGYETRLHSSLAGILHVTLAVKRARPFLISTFIEINLADSEVLNFVRNYHRSGSCTCSAAS